MLPARTSWAFLSAIAPGDPLHLAWDKNDASYEDQQAVQQNMGEVMATHAFSREVCLPPPMRRFERFVQSRHVAESPGSLLAAYYPEPSRVAPRIVLWIKMVSVYPPYDPPPHRRCRGTKKHIFFHAYKGLPLDEPIVLHVVAYLPSSKPETS